LKSTAAALDIIGFILMLTVVGEIGTMIIGITGDILFLVWFWFLGVNYFGGNSQSKLLTFITNSVAESIPFVNGIYPGFSVQAWRLIAIMKKEDEEKARKNAAKDEKMDAAMRRRQMQALAIRSRRIAANANAAQEASQAA
jgi:hypothetical protein